jgi:hypothetical protein
MAIFPCSAQPPGDVRPIAGSDGAAVGPVYTVLPLNTETSVQPPGGPQPNRAREVNLTARETGRVATSLRPKRLDRIHLRETLCGRGPIGLRPGIRM